MNKKLLLFPLLFCLFQLFVFAEDLLYRPACADPSTILDKPWNVTDKWEDGSLVYDTSGIVILGTHGNYTLCYINNSMMYIQYDWGLGVSPNEGKLIRDWEDIYSTDIGIGTRSKSLKASTGFTVHLEYYFPSNNGVCYPQDLGIWSVYGFPGSTYSVQIVTFNNMDYSEANCNGCTDFEDAKYELSGSELTCDTWHVFEMSSNDFMNTFGEHDKLVSFNFQFANAYVTNIWFHQKVGSSTYNLYP